MSIEGLLWPTGEEAGIGVGPEQIRSLFTQDRAIGEEDRPKQTRTRMKSMARLSWDLESDRYTTWEAIDEQAAALWAWLVKGEGRSIVPAIGLVLDGPVPKTVFLSSSSGGPSVEVHSVRRAARRTQKGSTVTDFVVEITQRRRGYFSRRNTKAKRYGGGACRSLGAGRFPLPLGLHASPRSEDHGSAARDQDTGLCD